MTPNKKTALVYAVDLLAVQQYSVQMLTDKLRRKGYQSEEIDEVVEKLRARGYLNDHDLCQHVYRQYIGEQKHSLRQIECKLRQKGFDTAMIDAARQQGDEETEKLAALKLIRAKFRSSGNEEIIKMMQFLYRKGFSRESIESAVSSHTGKHCEIGEE